MGALGISLVCSSRPIQPLGDIRHAFESEVKDSHELVDLFFNKLQFLKLKFLLLFQLLIELLPLILQLSIFCL